MVFDGKIGSLSTNIIQVVAAVHPAIILSGLIKRNQSLWEPGTILARDSDELTPWDGTGDPVGVLVDQCDSTGDYSANYLAHGVAVIENLKLADGSAPTETQIYILAKAGIYGA